jgi:ABC-type transporter Mla maintaining outer membrane lipid asymmetry permease subunit MlaE
MTNKAIETWAAEVETMTDEERLDVLHSINLDPERNLAASRVVRRALEET